MIKQNVNLIDSMTGLKNYTCFVNEFEELMPIALEKCEDLTLALIDIDNFKKVNDELGQKTGDDVLLSVKSHLTVNAPENCRVYRYAGDEFALVMPLTEREKAFLFLEKLRASYDASSLISANHNNNLNVTLSIGISSFPEDGNRMNEIVRKADGALFRAKVGGRNKVCLSREEKMITKTSHYTYEQLQRLSQLAKKEGMGEAVLLREALDDLLKKYSQ